MDKQTFLEMFPNKPVHDMVILHNSAGCALCGDVLVSMEPDDVVTCICGNLTIGGGLDLLNRASNTPGDFVEYSEVVTYSGQEVAVPSV